MNIIKTDFADLFVIEPKVWGDDRGYFFESFKQERFLDEGLSYDWIQDNESFSERGVLRGLHYQLNPAAQTKLVRVVHGEVLDVVVDIRSNSDTYGKSFSIRLSGENKKQLLVPSGFAHGYVVLSDTAIFLYKVDNPYSQAEERGIKFDDPSLNIDWILDKSEFQLSAKDKVQPLFADHDPFVKMNNAKIKVLVTGANGQLGQSFQKIAPLHPQYDFHFYSSKQLDITDGMAVSNEVKRLDPAVFINCAAYTKVDDAEDHEEVNWNVNVIATHNIAGICKRNDVLLLHYSTDYVYHNIQEKIVKWDVKEEKRKKMDELTATNPQGKYAASKLRSEEVIQGVCPQAVIMRTSWIYSEFGHNFLRTMLKLGKEKDSLNVVCDQIGCPTYATDIAETTVKIIAQILDETVILEEPCIINYAGEGQLSWCDFADYIFECANIQLNLKPISTEKYPTKVLRPKWSMMDMTKVKTIFGVEPKDWKESTKVCVDLLLKTN